MVCDRVLRMGGLLCMPFCMPFCMLFCILFVFWSPSRGELRLLEVLE